MPLLTSPLSSFNSPSFFRFKSVSMSVIRVGASSCRVSGGGMMEDWALIEDLLEMRMVANKDRILGKAFVESTDYA